MVKEVICNNCVRSVYFNEEDIKKEIKLYCPFCHAEMIVDEVDEQMVTNSEAVIKLLDELMEDMKTDPSQYTKYFLGAFKATVTKQALHKIMSYDEYVWEELEARLRQREDYRQLYKQFSRILRSTVDLGTRAEAFADGVICAFIHEIGKRHIGYTTVFQPFADMNDYTLIVDGLSSLRHVIVDYFVRMLETISEEQAKSLTGVLVKNVSDEAIIREYILKYYDDIPTSKAGKKEFMKALNKLELRSSIASYTRDMTGAVVREKNRKSMFEFVY